MSLPSGGIGFISVIKDDFEREPNLIISITDAEKHDFSQDYEFEFY